jgi:hypothetical protein
MSEILYLTRNAKIAGGRRCQSGGKWCAVRLFGRPFFAEPERIAAQAGGRKREISSSAGCQFFAQGNLVCRVSFLLHIFPNLHFLPVQLASH